MKKNLLVGIIVTIMMAMAVIIAYQSGALVSADRCIKEYEAENRKLQNEISAKEEEINEVSKYNYVVVNDDLDVAAKKVEAILISEKCRVDRIESIDVDNIEEEIHEALIS